MICGVSGRGGFGDKNGVAMGSFGDRRSSSGEVSAVGW